jgi:hypothetical protein
MRPMFAIALAAYHRVIARQRWCGARVRALADAQQVEAWLSKFDVMPAFATFDPWAAAARPPEAAGVDSAGKRADEAAAALLRPRRAGAGPGARTSAAEPGARPSPPSPGSGPGQALSRGEGGVFSLLPPGEGLGMRESTHLPGHSIPDPDLFPMREERNAVASHAARLSSRRASIEPPRREPIRTAGSAAPWSAAQPGAAVPAPAQAMPAATDGPLSGLSPIRPGPAAFPRLPPEPAAGARALLAFLQAYERGCEASLPARPGEAAGRVATDGTAPAMELLGGLLGTLWPARGDGYAKPEATEQSAGQPAPTAAGAGAADAAEATAAPRPRAPSRLLSGEAPAPIPGSAPGEVVQSAAPPHAPAPAPNADDMDADGFAQQINRLLLDQAWLRGVDLT